MNIRLATEADTARIANLFTESVHGIAYRSYNASQLIAWAPQPPELAQWKTNLASLTTLLAELDSVPTGFISFSKQGHIEFLFVTPRFSRRKVATRLYAAASEILCQNGIDTITTVASLEARPFFERQGFKVIEEELVERRGVRLKRYKMERVLSVG